MRAWRKVAPRAQCIGSLSKAARYSSSNQNVYKRFNLNDLWKTSSPESQGQANNIQVDGFVRTIRKQKRFAFASISDGSISQPVQAVLTPEQAESLSNGAAVRLQGSWVKSQGKGQSHELQVENAQILGEHDVETYPIQKKYQTPEFLRTIPHLRARVPHNTLLLHLRSQVIASVTKFFGQNGFVQTHTPIITSSDCEGAGEVFTISANASPPAEAKPKDGQVEHFFRAPKYLTVSSQLHLEALAQAVGKVWTLSPTFRAEKSDTPRHLSEFYMLEAELCFVDDMEQVMQIVEDMLRSVAQDLHDSAIFNEIVKARESASPEAKAGDNFADPDVMRQRLDALRRTEWPRVSYEKAVKALERAAQNGEKFEFAPSVENGLQAEHEKYLAKSLGREGPVFITDYPRQQKPFYMASSEDLRSAKCFDLLLPEVCEMVGGSMREYRSKQLVDSMNEHGLLKNEVSQDHDHDELAKKDAKRADASHASSLQWYVDLRRYGSVQHGGFGLGFDRLISYLSGTPNIRDVVAFPRWHGRCDC